MALSNGTIFSIQASATTGNVNGAGFNPNNANFPADLAATSATSASPVVTSATYSFVVGDVGNWVYIKSGTNWISGWYQISSVATGAATLSAAIGAAVLSIGATGIVTRNAVAGCATTSSPTSGTYGVDYSQSDTANSSITDASSAISSTTLISVTAPWTPVSVGNFFHLTAGTNAVVGWYEIVSYNAAGSVVTDRTTNTGIALASGVGNTGGAGRFNGLESTFHLMVPAASIVWIKSGSYTFSGSVASGSTNSTGTNPSFFIGYFSIRGDVCNGASRPLFVTGTANSISLSQDTIYKNISLIGSIATILSSTTGCQILNCKVVNNSSIAGRVAILAGGVTMGASVIGCEITSINGIGLNTGNASVFRIIGNYIHDCSIGFSTNLSNAGTVIGNIFEANGVVDLLDSVSTGGAYVVGNTFYGSEARLGIGLNLSAANSPGNTVYNNIFYGKVTGISVTTGNANTNLGQYNTFFNNTSDVSNWIKDTTDVAINPAFVGASQITGTTATTSGSVLTDSSANFSGVNDAIDYLHVISGTGVTVAIYPIVSHTSTTLTVTNSLGTSSAGNVVYFITNGHNFQVGSAIVGIGAPNFTNSTGGQTTSFPTIGAVVPQAAAAAGMLINPGLVGGMHG